MKNVMEKEKIVLVGCGQHARVVMFNMKAQGKYEVACFLDADINKVGSIYEGYEIAGTYENLNVIHKRFNTKKFFISFGDMKLRKCTYEYFIDAGWEAVNIIHPDAIISDDAVVGNGVLVECGCLITPNPRIGNNVVINTGSQVNHDNTIEDHVYIASGVILSGGVTIKENTLIDDGVIVTLGKTVPADSIVGAGAVVTKNFNFSGIYYGNPAKLIRKK